jgi:hypothetical protein
MSGSTTLAQSQGREVELLTEILAFIEHPSSSPERGAEVMASLRLVKARIQELSATNSDALAAANDAFKEALEAFNLARTASKGGTN